MGANGMRTQRGRGGRGAQAHTRTHVFSHTHTHVHCCSPSPQGLRHPPGVPRVNVWGGAGLCSPQSHVGAGRGLVRNWVTGGSHGCQQPPDGPGGRSPGSREARTPRNAPILTALGGDFGLPDVLEDGVALLVFQRVLVLLGAAALLGHPGRSTSLRGPRDVPDLGAWGAGSAPAVPQGMGGEWGASGEALPGSPQKILVLEQSKPPTFLVLGKKGSHLSLSGRDWAFSLAPATRGSRLRMPAWFM